MHIKFIFIAWPQFVTRTIYAPYLLLEYIKTVPLYLSTILHSTEHVYKTLTG